MHSLSALIETSFYAAALAAVGLSAQSAGVSGQGSWETTLQARDINGDGGIDAYYDTALNITWLANWNTNGTQSWNTVAAWAASVNLDGVTGWRLPSTNDTGLPGCDYSNPGPGAARTAASTSPPAVLRWLTCTT